MSQSLILLVEDDTDIMETNRDALVMEGYRVVTAGTIADAKASVVREEPDLIVLDITLPDGNGLEYCGELRGGGVRILFLSALNTKEDSIAGIKAGGDDYITKPYVMDDLLVRVDALMRRGKLLTGAEEPPLRLSGLEINFSYGRALLYGEDLLLKPKEFALLVILTHNRGRYVTAEKLYETVWGMNSVNDVQTVWEHISRLRRKLGRNARRSIKSARGKGYCLSVDN